MTMGHPGRTDVGRTGPLGTFGTTRVRSKVPILPLTSD